MTTPLVRSSTVLHAASTPNVCTYSQTRGAEGQAHLEKKVKNVQHPTRQAPTGHRYVRNAEEGSWSRF